jgi:hypothetical protein
MASPKKKKARQVNVDLAEAVTTMVIDVHLEKDIDATSTCVFSRGIRNQCNE